MGNNNKSRAAKVLVLAGICLLSFYGIGNNMKERKRDGSYQVFISDHTIGLAIISIVSGGWAVKTLFDFKKP